MLISSLDNDACRSQMWLYRQNGASDILKYTIMPAHCEIWKAPTETTGVPGQFPEELQDQRFKNIKGICGICNT